MTRRTRRHRTETGYTLIELIVVLTILATITGAITATFLTANNANANVSERIHESNDAQLTAGFWTADAQAAGGVNPVLGATDTSLGVSASDSGGCSLGGGTPVFSFKWKEWASRISTPPVHDTYTTRVANYVYRAGTAELERRTCSDAAVPGTLASTGVVTLATRVAFAPTVTCDDAACPSTPRSLPNIVRISVTETNRPSTSTSGPYRFELSATVRSQAQTAPTSGTAAAIPLLAFGSSTCLNSTTGLSVTGATTVNVNGQGAVNAVDAGGCNAIFASSAALSYTSNGTSLTTGGTCGGNACAQVGPITTDASAIGDPFATLAAPGSCSGGSGSPSAGQPGVYHDAAAITGALAAGTYIFCSTVSFSGSVTGTGVLLYFAGASTTFSLGGNVNINLTAPTTGDYAGILMWNATSNAVNINGNGSIANYNGVLYSPNADVMVAGTSSTYIGSIIARRVYFSGNHTTDITNGSVTPGAPPLTAATGTVLRQVHLSWSAPGYTGAVGSPITGYEYRVDTGSGYGAWTAVPGGAAATTYDHTCGTSDTVPTTCTYQLRALNGQGAGNASAPSSAPSFADSTAPTVTVTAPAAGATVGRTATFSGTAGNATGDGATVTVTVYAGANCSGASVTASANRIGTTWTVTMNGLIDGAKSVCASQSDWVGNTGTSAPVAFTVAPVLGMTVTNANGRLAANDTVVITFGQAINPASICAGWNGTTTRTTLTVTVTNNDPTTGNNDSLTVTDSGCALNVGKVNLGSQGWVTATTNYAGGASTAVMNAGLTTLTLKVGTGTQGPANNAATTMTYTPSIAMKDSLGTPMAGAFGFPSKRF